ncbi:hypothetical protein AM231_10845 [Paenibacillus solani]|uniref:Uncharacterized protein n=2 Tax=Paenibacillus solani TaxID=1705565 RepID=A0A0M1P514_9BACL|nr:hypothetical protein AM231_10845 [Paenibacillus solani]
MLGGAIWAGIIIKHTDANSPSLEEKLESAYYENHQNLEDTAVQQVLYELEQKGKLIAQFENSLLEAQSQDLNGESVHRDSLLHMFYEETNKLNQELYTEMFK